LVGQSTLHVSTRAWVSEDASTKQIWMLIEYGSVELRRHCAPRKVYFTGAIASLAALATRNFTAVFALILIDSPVCGLRPIRAAR